MRQSKGVSSARDGMVKDQAGSTTTPIMSSATRAHEDSFMSWGTEAGADCVFLRQSWVCWQGWSHGSIDMRSSAESRSVVGARQRELPSFVSCEAEVCF